MESSQNRQTSPNRTGAENAKLRVGRGRVKDSTGHRCEHLEFATDCLKLPGATATFKRKEEKHPVGCMKRTCRSLALYNNIKSCILGLC